VARLGLGPFESGVFASTDNARDIAVAALQPQKVAQNEFRR
jgi:hypothetical protein